MRQGSRHQSHTKPKRKTIPGPDAVRIFVDYDPHRPADSVDYYYSCGTSKNTDVPGLTDMLREALDVAFREDAAMLEGQHERVREKPDFPMVNLPFDERPAKMAWVLDKILR